MNLQTHSIDPGHVTVDSEAVHLRVEIAGEVIANTARALVVREKGLPPRYYAPPEDVRMDLLERTTDGAHCPYKGDWIHLNVRIGDRVIPKVAWTYDRTYVDGPQIKNYLAFYPEKADVFHVS